MAGFEAILRRLKAGGEVIVADGTDLVLRTAPRHRRQELWDLTVCLDVRVAELQWLLIARRHPGGLSDAEAWRRAFDNVIPSQSG